MSVGRTYIDTHGRSGDFYVRLEPHAGDDGLCGFKLIMTNWNKLAAPKYIRKDLRGMRQYIPDSPHVARPKPQTTYSYIPAQPKPVSPFDPTEQRCPECGTLSYGESECPNCGYAYA